MRLLITGASGQVGWQLCRRLPPLGEIIALDRNQCDLSRLERLADAVRDLRPDIVVNAAAYTAVDRAEAEQQLAMAVNGTAPGILAEEARKCGALFIHYSTDYVFDGTKDSPYTEDDPPCPINAYGRSKAEGDAAVREAAGAYAILRTSWIYDSRGHNFLRTMLRLFREREEVRVVADQVGAPTWARRIADATAIVIQDFLDRGSFESGLFNLTATGATSWHGFTEAILEGAREEGLIAKAGPRLVPIASEDYPQPARRPKNSRLSGDRFRQRFGAVLPPWEQDLRLCLAPPALL